MAELPYPEVRVSGPNRACARMMLDNLAGSSSEMTAVSLYFYDHMVLKQMEAEAAEAFHHISVVEMHHLAIFGELALQLGADPRLWCVSGAQTRYWSPAFCHYSRDLPMIFRQAAEHERETIQKYSQQAQTIQDPCIVEILGRIIQDEEKHLAFFQEMHQKCISQGRQVP